MTSLTEAIVAGVIQSMDPAKAQEQQLMEVWMSSQTSAYQSHVESQCKRCEDAQAFGKDQCRLADSLEKVFKRINKI